MAADGWFPQWFAGAWFPPVWFAPADEEHLTPEEIATEYHGGGKKHGVSRDDLTPEEVRSQWELLELRTRERAQGNDATPANDQNPIKSEDPGPANDSGEPPAVEQGNYQGILTSSPDSETIADTQADEAKQARKNRARALLLMEL